MNLAKSYHTPRTSHYPDSVRSSKESSFTQSPSLFHGLSYTDFASCENITFDEMPKPEKSYKKSVRFADQHFPMFSLTLTPQPAMTTSMTRPGILKKPQKLSLAAVKDSVRQINYAFFFVGISYLLILYFCVKTVVNTALKMFGGVINMIE